MSTPIQLKKRQIPADLLPFFYKKKEGDRWRLRNIICWYKPNAMPSSVRDRFSVDWEPIFFFSKSKKYWFEQQFDPLSEVYLKDKRPFNILRQRLYPRSKYVKEHYGSNQFKTKKLVGYRDAIPVGGANIEYGGINDPIAHKETEQRMRERGVRSKRCVWRIPTQPFKDAHFATFPEKLIEPMIKAGCPEFICKKCGKAREAILEPSEEYKKLLGKSWHNHSADAEQGATQKTGIATTADYKLKGYSDCHCNAGWNKGIILDPFMGSGTTAVVAKKLGRNYVGIELNLNYIKMAEKRLQQEVLL